ncbi:MAG TPA: redoxin domain-containing protein [Methanomassiliicoccales archaeon]|nr:redoxin domain-containing protein [Methanomassiliicoccales archaeon]
MDHSDTLRVGSTAPSFALPDERGAMRRDSEFLERGPMVLLFVPSVWGIMCNVEMNAVREMHDRFVAANASVVVITTQSSMANAPYVEHMRLQFPFLSDFDGKISAKYGVLFGDEGYMKGRPNRAVFVVDQGMKVRFCWVGDDPSFEPDYEAVLAAAIEAAR